MSRSAPHRALPAGCSIAILGGGPAGCAAALTLHQAGVRDILVIEAGDYGRRRAGESLPPDTRNLLMRLGVWEDFTADAHDPCLGNRSAWGGPQVGFTDFLLNPHGPGWHLDRRRFDGMLARAVQQRGMALHTATRFVTSRRTAAGGHSLTVRDTAGQHTVGADFVIDATGLHSRFARSQGAVRNTLDALFFVYGFFRAPANVSINTFTTLEAVDYGWWYKAALPGRHLCIAVACDADTLRARRLNDWSHWLNSLTETTLVSRELHGYRFMPDALLKTPAPSALLSPLTGDGWLAVGDAASSFDPLMARGIHKALEDGIEAGEWVARTGTRHPARSIEERFREYERMRQYFYEQEQRWAQIPFWRRRHNPPTLFPTAAKTPGGDSQHHALSTA